MLPLDSLSAFSTSHTDTTVTRPGKRAVRHEREPVVSSALMPRLAMQPSAVSTPMQVTHAHRSAAYTLMAARFARLEVRDWDTAPGAGALRGTVLLPDGRRFSLLVRQQGAGFHVHDAELNVRYPVLPSRTAAFFVTQYGYGLPSGVLQAAGKRDATALTGESSTSTAAPAPKRSRAAATLAPPSAPGGNDQDALVPRTGLARSSERTGSEWRDFAFTVQEGQPNSLVKTTYQRSAMHFVDVLSSTGVPLLSLDLEQALQPQLPGRPHHNDWMRAILHRLSAREAIALDAGEIDLLDAQGMVDALRTMALRDAVDALRDNIGVAQHDDINWRIRKKWRAADKAKIGRMSSNELDAALAEGGRGLNRYGLGEQACLKLDLNEFILLPPCLGGATVLAATQTSSNPASALGHICGFLDVVLEHNAAPAGTDWRFGVSYTGGLATKPGYTPRNPFNAWMLDEYKADPAIGWNDGGQARACQSAAHSLLRHFDEESSPCSPDGVAQLDRLEPGYEDERLRHGKYGFLPWWERNAPQKRDEFAQQASAAAGVATASSNNAQDAVVARTDLKRDSTRSNGQWLDAAFTPAAGQRQPPVKGQCKAAALHFVRQVLESTGVPLQSLELEGAMQPRVPGQAHHNDWLRPVLHRLAARNAIPLDAAAVDQLDAQGMVDALRRMALVDAVAALWSDAGHAAHDALNQRLRPQWPDREFARIATMTTGELGAALSEGRANQHGLGEQACLKLTLNEFILLPPRLGGMSVVAAAATSNNPSNAVSNICAFLGFVSEHSTAPAGSGWTFGATYTGGLAGKANYLSRHPFNAWMQAQYKSDPALRWGDAASNDCLMAAHALMRHLDEETSPCSPNPLAGADEIDPGYEEDKLHHRAFGFVPWWEKNVAEKRSVYVPGVTVASSDPPVRPRWPVKDMPSDPDHLANLMMYRDSCGFRNACRAVQGQPPLQPSAQSAWVARWARFLQRLDTMTLTADMVDSTSDGDLALALPLFGLTAAGDAAADRAALLAKALDGSGAPIRYRTFMALPCSTQLAAAEAITGRDPAMMTVVKDATGLPLVRDYIPVTWRPNLDCNATLLDACAALDGVDEHQLRVARHLVLRLEQQWQPGGMTLRTLWNSPSQDACSDALTQLGFGGVDRARTIVLFSMLSAQARAPGGIVVPDPDTRPYLNINAAFLDFHLRGLADDAQRNAARPLLVAWMRSANSPASMQHDVTFNHVIADLNLPSGDFVQIAGMRLNRPLDAAAQAALTDFRDTVWRLAVW